MERRTIMRHISFTVFLYLAIATVAYADIITAWDFNDAIPGEIGGTLEFTPDYGNGFMTSNFQANNIENTTGSTLNSQTGAPAGRSLHLSGQVNNGNSLTWLVDTIGYASIDVSFATRRTSTGFSSNQFFYSIDSGDSWLSFGAPYEPDLDFGLQSFNLAAVETLNNSSGAGFRIVFDGATSYSGNNRIDNLVVSGVPASIPDVTPVPEPATAVLLGLGLLSVFSLALLYR